MVTQISFAPAVIDSPALTNAQKPTAEAGIFLSKVGFFFNRQILDGRRYRCQPRYLPVKFIKPQNRQRSQLKPSLPEFNAAPAILTAG